MRGLCTDDILAIRKQLRVEWRIVVEGMVEVRLGVGALYSLRWGVEGCDEDEKCTKEAPCWFFGRPTPPFAARRLNMDDV